VLEQFDEILADVAVAAAGRATAPGAGAARKRGGQRRMRRQLTAATTLSLALIGGLGLVGAVGALAFRGGDGSGATSGTAATYGVSSLPVPAPGKYVAGAWLSQSQLPYAGTITWQDNPQTLGTTMRGAVQLVLPGSSFFYSAVSGFGTYCSIPALANGALADQLQWFDGPITGSALPHTAGIPADVDQSAVFYRNQGAAAAAWDSIGDGFAACAKATTGHVSGESADYPSAGTASRIVDEPDAQCWTNLTAVSNIGPAVTDFLDEVCFVRRGTVIGMTDLGFEGPSGLSSVDFRSVDATTITDLQQALNAYGGN
jgi:hypothetical protein